MHPTSPYTIMLLGAILLALLAVIFIGYQAVNKKSCALCFVLGAVVVSCFWLANPLAIVAVHDPVTGGQYVVREAPFAGYCLADDVLQDMRSGSGRYEAVAVVPEQPRAKAIKR